MLEKKNERRSFANKSEVLIGMNGCLVDMSYVKMGHKSFVMSFAITSAGLACLEAGRPWLNPAPEQVQSQALKVGSLNAGVMFCYCVLGCKLVTNLKSCYHFATC